jgi:DNA primase
VLFPILDLRGRPVAFGGRVMGDGEPKYLNSADTPLFHKGKQLYGLSLAREAAAAREEIVVVEGYMDVIAMAQAGIENTVAPLGTALTETQLALLWRYAAEPMLCFDNDKAGRAAALRAANRALPELKPGFSLRFVQLPAGKDPDDICRA